jgi:hypothetical protein
MDKRLVAIDGFDTLTACTFHMYATHTPGCGYRTWFFCCRIQTRQGAQLMDKRLVVAIDSWDTDSMYPSGHYVRTLGVIGDRDVETVRFLI